MWISSTLANLETNVGDLPSWALLIPSIAGAIALVWYRTKRGTPAFEIAGKVFFGFTIGYFLGGEIAARYGYSRITGSFVASLLAPTVFQQFESIVAVFKKTSSQKEEES